MKSDRRHRPLTLCLALAFCLVATSCGEQDGGPVLVVGTKNFTEQLILGEMIAQLIEAKTEIAVDRKFNLGGTMICHGAIVAGEIDVYPEYTGTALTAILNRAVISDPDSAYQVVVDAYGEQFGCSWLAPFGFNNTYAITVQEGRAKAEGWETVEDLRKAAPSLTAGFTAEFAERPDGYPGLSKAYGFEIGSVRDLDPGLMYSAVAEGHVDVICAFATDGRIAAYDLKPLEDDRGFFPPYYAAPVVRSDILKARPELEKVLGGLAGALSDSTMQQLNYQVDEKQMEPATVSRQFLKARGLLK